MLIKKKFRSSAPFHVLAMIPLNPSARPFVTLDLHSSGLFVLYYLMEMPVAKVTRFHKLYSLRFSFPASLKSIYCSLIHYIVEYCSSSGIQPSSYWWFGWVCLKEFSLDVSFYVHHSIPTLQLYTLLT